MVNIILQIEEAAAVYPLYVTKLILRRQLSRTLTNVALFDSAKTIKATDKSRVDSITLPLKKNTQDPCLCQHWDPLTPSRFTPITLNRRQEDNGYPCK